MYSKVWNSCHASICQLVFLNERGVTVDSLTGFKVNNHLITSQHASKISKAYKVDITFVGPDANTVTATTRIPYQEFLHNHRIGVADETGHYAVFEIDLPEFEMIPSLKLSEQRNLVIGSPLVSLSFICGYSNLALKTGIISSYFTNNEGLRFIQFDGSIGCGNSGAPLIDPETMEVVGIVSRRDTPAAKAHIQLMDILSSNLVELRKVESSVKFGDIDPIQVLIANQNQLKQLAKIIYKHSSHSVSFATTLDKVLSFFNHDSHLNVEANAPVYKNEEFDSYYG